ncbi:ABC transporter permease [Modestobacter sp. I12A-02662]|uniref:ABC transporter permease n=1 Tax=Modestobacter sp. I12A-02662 TaxID=1730496 RepID=UPI0034DDEDD7
MGSSVVDLGPGLVVALLALTAIAAAAGRLCGLGQDRPVVVAVVRATVQLAAVSAVLSAVLRSVWLSAAFVLLMLGVAAGTAAGRTTRRPLRSPGAARRVGACGLAIAAGAAPVVGVVLGQRDGATRGHRGGPGRRHRHRRRHDRHLAGRPPAPRRARAAPG